MTPSLSFTAIYNIIFLKGFPTGTIKILITIQAIHLFRLQHTLINVCCPDYKIISVRIINRGFMRTIHDLIRHELQL
ncbi:hypothetical protein D9M71_710640 [compost metagenome]